MSNDVDAPLFRVALHMSSEPLGAHPAGRFPKLIGKLNASATDDANPVAGPLFVSVVCTVVVAPTGSGSTVVWVTADAKSVVPVPAPIVNWKVRVFAGLGSPAEVADNVHLAGPPS